MRNWTHLNIENEKGKYLYKFLPEKFLIEFAKTGNIWFARADKFGDKLECITIPQLKQESLDIEKVIKTQQKHLISCFHLATYETLAFWDTYASNEETRRNYCIRFLKTDLDQLLRNSKIGKDLESIISSKFHGKVEYKNLLTSKIEKLNEKKVRKSSLRKEYAFAYEKEYRYIIRSENQFEVEGINLKIGIPIELNFNILVNPLLDNNKYESCINKLTELGLKDKFYITKITKFFKPNIKKYE